jgi:hypothetical protein
MSRDYRIMIRRLLHALSSWAARKNKIGDAVTSSLPESFLELSGAILLQIGTKTANFAHLLFSFGSRRLYDRNTF